MIIDAHIHNAEPDCFNMEQTFRRGAMLGISLMGNLGDVLANGLFPTANEVKTINDRSLVLDNKYNQQMFSFCFLNPTNPTNFSLAEIERCLVDEGKNFVGIKFEAGLNCRDKKLDPIMQRAEQLGAIVVHHSWYKATGIQPNESDPAAVANLAERFPNVTIICPHLAGIGRRGILDLAPYHNVMVDTSGGQPIAGLVEYAVTKLGAERLLFGSDLYGAYGRDPACQLGRILGANIKEQDKELIIGLNAKRILKL